MSNATAKIEVHLDVETQIQMKILIGEFFSNQWKYFKSKNFDIRVSWKKC